MSASDAIDQQCKDFVASIGTFSLADRPWITITYAQSMDGRIAALPGDPRLIISGTESMQMTMRLRAIHQAIMVTASTLNADDSQLTVRNTPEASAADFKQPQPIILDPTLQTSISSRILSPKRTPWILCLAEYAQSQAADDLRSHGAILFAMSCSSSSPKRISLSTIAAFLHQRGIKSLLIEPGLRFIPTLLAEPNVLDALVVTTAPVFIGSRGRAPSFDKVQECSLTNVKLLQIGQDTVSAALFRKM